MGSRAKDNIHKAMRLVAEALEKDGQDKPGEAYVAYLKSTLYITQTLLEDAQATGGTMGVDGKKLVRLGQQCMERVAFMADPSSSQNKNQVSAPARSPVEPPKPAARTPTSSYRPASLQQDRKRGPQKKRGPMELAYQENQKITAAYQARIAKMQTGEQRAVNMNLSLQRKLAENMAIAGAREQALKRKMQERQRRLHEMAARRFTVTTGMTKEEQERRQLYTKILEFEQDTKWPIAWRDRLKMHPENSQLVQDLIRQILSVQQHPLTQLLRSYQKRLQVKLEPLVINHLEDLDKISVPYTRPAAAAASEDKKDEMSISSPGTSNSPTENEAGESKDQNLEENDTNSGQHSGDISDSPRDASARTDSANDAESPTVAAVGGFADSYSQAKDDLAEAISKGESLSQSLKERNPSDEAKQEPVTPEHYDVEDMDDLFNDDDFEILTGEDLTPESPHTLSNQDDSIKTPEIEADKEKLKQMKQEAFTRHAQNISKDVRQDLEKILAMFIVAYEQLDTPVGRDLCYSCLEEPFFQPVWQYLIGLFRLANKDQEVETAVSMTQHSQCVPADLKVQPQLRLVATFPTPYTHPYEPAVKELQRLPELVCPLTKLECIVNVTKKICHCVQEHYEQSGAAQDVPSIGADDLLPVLSYVIIKSACPTVVSECQAMEEFIHEGYLMGEEGYSLASLQTALRYVIQLADKSPHSTPSPEPQE